MATKSAKINTVPESLSGVLLRPRITEKATMLGEKNVYTFDVSPRANKDMVARAVKAVYGMTPIRVNISQIKPKAIFVRGKMGTKGGGKKAMVYLKKGDKIEFV
ncbi:MAG: 50S ribosomal protein L23 [Patescibacteria group bacterium]